MKSFNNIQDKKPLYSPHQLPDGAYVGSIQLARGKTSRVPEELPRDAPHNILFSTITILPDPDLPI